MRRLMLELREGRHSFAFELSRKATRLGDIVLDHYWMSHNSLYGQRNCFGRNGRQVVDFFWNLCLEHGTVIDDEVVDSFILASLHPIVRSNGSRHVFSDGILSNAKHFGFTTDEQTEDLDLELASKRQEIATAAEFRNRTAIALACPLPDDEARAAYSEFERRLFEQGRGAVRRLGPDGLVISRECWSEWMRKIARRSGEATKKTVLDMLSYEAKAALHRAYSAAWCRLLPRLRDEFDLTAESWNFHRLWHLDLPVEAGARDTCHLFHGHVLGLHPIGSAFIQTTTGKRLLADYIPRLDEDAKGRLLNGLAITAEDYARRRELYRLLRQSDSPHIDTVEGYDSVDGRRTDRRRAGRSPGSERN